ncbi:MAG: glycosyl hydrolase family 95 catalytic domain-containing protein [bacterium]
MSFESDSFDVAEVAAAHPLTFTGPAVDFFQGALLGNGALGAVVTTRPDAVVVRFGHNAVWDIRVAEANREKIGTFQEIFGKIRAIADTHDDLRDDPWYRQYMAAMEANYNKPYPRPFPCGSLLLGWDPRQVEVLGHRTDIATGVCTINLLVDDAASRVELFVDMDADRLWIQYLDDAPDSAGLRTHPFKRIRLLPDPQTPQQFPERKVAEDLPAGRMSFDQTLPCEVPERYDPAVGQAKDKAFCLSVCVNVPMVRRPRLMAHHRRCARPLEAEPAREATFVACAQLDHGMAHDLQRDEPAWPGASRDDYVEAAQRSQARWRDYWPCSGVKLADRALERTWYHNLYFFNCAVRPGVTCPGLFANWSFGQIGTAWHGDYHLNYNTQQPFWLAFSSNHVDKHLPYVDMVDLLRPLSRKWAKDYYGMRGAYFPHSAYPVPTTIMPYPVPTWGWEICETPWAVQSLWWHYLYTQDIEFLRDRAFQPIREAVCFLVDYMTRPEAHGEQWGDDRYHIFPTVPPELYGLMPGFRFNHDCLADLTLTRFVFRAYLKACAELDCERAEQTLVQQVRDVLAHMPDYATADTSHGKVFLAVPGEDPDIVYNVPCSTMTVFPGEEHGLETPPEVFETAANSYRRQRNEGGNELVFANLIGARLGLLDLNRFKRQIEYCTLPNGTCTNMVLQVDGRYDDDTPFDFMADMGIWFENFSLPAVINECLLQSYNGTIRLFPSWPDRLPAAFQTLRAAGAFLVSAEQDRQGVQWVKIVSEAGRPLRLVNPWPGGARCRSDDACTVVTDGIIEVQTHVGQTLVFTAAAELSAQPTGVVPPIADTGAKRTEGETS